MSMRSVRRALVGVHFRNFCCFWSLCALSLLPAYAQQPDYPRWSQYEARAAQLTAEQFATTRQLAQDGDVDAEMLITAAYHLGIGVARDGKESLVWLQRAAV